MNRKLFIPRLVIGVATCLLSLSREAAPGQSGAPVGDEIGMARELGPETWARCAAHLSNPRAKAYELSHVRSNTMPLSPFAGPFELTYLPSNALPGSTQVFNMDVLNENVNPGQQGTQMDALGHFARLDNAWEARRPYPWKERDIMAGSPRRT